MLSVLNDKCTEYTASKSKGTNSEYEVERNSREDKESSNLVFKVFGFRNRLGKVHWGRQLQFPAQSPR